ncbi:hypothetical protein [Salinimicrobium flavum]|uniref:Uncharacterized protein n=1 Tax=Salinimicrobium flavum TaxID=1737065 RepID=A0ABW5IZ53_9FLAO
MKAIYKTGLILFIGLLMFPSALDLAHVFSGHKHTICNHYAESHFHQENVDCDLFHFQKTPLPYSELFTYSLLIPEVRAEKSEAIYVFPGSCKKLPYTLRGPPVLA